MGLWEGFYSALSGKVRQMNPKSGEEGSGGVWCVVCVWWRCGRYQSVGMPLFFAPLHRQRLRSVVQQLRYTRRAGIATRRNSLLASHQGSLDWTSKCPGSSTIMVLLQIRVRIVSLLRYQIEMRRRHDDHFARVRNDL